MPDEKELTLMVYFASDNPLAPGIVSQLKAIKQAGFHHDANVVAQFDPQPEGTPTHIFDVNRIMKLFNPQPKIGFIGFTENDPFVSNLLEDKLWRGERDPQLDRNGHPIRGRLRESFARRNIDYNPPEPPLDKTKGEPAKANGGETKEGAHNTDKDHKERELNPKESLEAFLTFCREAYPARRYMLFILGHGVVVGNDVFLFDENPDKQSLSLKELGGLLTDFKKNLNAGAKFELISFHSCSVSSMEVAYELAGTANYMLASQGPAFVGSWPYRQILMRIFNNMAQLKDDERSGDEEKVKENVKEMLRDIFSYCYYNSTDFLLAGYSFDLCLCNLNKVKEITGPLVGLSEKLQAGLADENKLVRDFILLAHWEAQSHWQESYTDLHDFCFTLSRKCGEFLQGLGEDAGQILGQTHTTLENIIDACNEVADQLKQERFGAKDEKIIIKSEFAGPGHQYSHGLSVYFPWSEPISDRQILVDYEKYDFNETAWLSFLRAYFARTMRESRKSEMMNMAGETTARPQRDDEMLAEDMLSLVFNREGSLSRETSPADVLKVTPRDPTGDECTCPSVKNYPRDTRPLSQTQRRASSGEKSVPSSQPLTGQRFSLIQ